MAKDLNSGLPRTKFVLGSPEFSLFNKLAIRVGLEHRASELKVQHTKFLYQEKIDKKFFKFTNSLSIKLSKGKLIYKQ